MYVNDRGGQAIDVLRRSGGTWTFDTAVPTQPGTAPYLTIVPTGEPAPSGSLGAGSLGGLTGPLGS